MKNPRLIKNQTMSNWVRVLSVCLPFIGTCITEGVKVETEHQDAAQQALLDTAAQTAHSMQQRHHRHHAGVCK